MTLTYLTRKQFRTIQPNPQYIAFTDLLNRKAYVKYHASTKTRLHESYHLKNSTMEDASWWDTWAVDELKARGYASKMIGSDLTTSDIQAVTAHLIERARFRPNLATSIIEDALQQCGIYLTNELFSDIWWFARQYYKQSRNNSQPTVSGVAFRG